MELEEDTKVLGYTLSILIAIAIVANLLATLIRGCKLKTKIVPPCLKYNLIITDVAYVCLGLSVMLLILHVHWKNDEIICTTGGAFAIFSIQTLIFLTATSSLMLLLWQRLSTIIQSRQCMWIFVLVSIAQVGISSTHAFLPLTKALPFFENHARYHFPCVQLRIPEEHGWIYTLTILTINMVAIVTALLCHSVTVFHLIKIPNSLKYTDLQQHPTKRKATFSILLSNGADSVFWTVTMVIVFLAYFKLSNLDRTGVLWVLAFWITAMCILHAIFSIPSMTNRHHCYHDNLETMVMHWREQHAPSHLEEIHKLPESEKGIPKFCIKWKDKNGLLLDGVMKMYSPDQKPLWGREMSTLTHLHGAEHPNVAKYIWISRKNPYTSVINTVGGGMMGREYRIICEQYFAHGNLKTFLNNLGHQMTELHVHQLATDVSSGLSHLHSLGILHNNLTSKAVYITGQVQTMSIQAVIGDFENCQFVMPENTKLSHSENKHSKEFMPDIRSLGILLLELVATLYQQKGDSGKFTQNQREAVKQMLSKSHDHEQANKISSSGTEKPNEKKTKRKLPKIISCGREETKVKSLLPDVVTSNYGADGRSPRIHRHLPKIPSQHTIFQAWGNQDIGREESKKSERVSNDVSNDCDKMPPSTDTSKFASKTSKAASNKVQDISRLDSQQLPMSPKFTTDYKICYDTFSIASVDSLNSIDEEMSMTERRRKRRQLPKIPLTKRKLPAVPLQPEPNTVSGPPTLAYKMHSVAKKEFKENSRELKHAKLTAEIHNHLSPDDRLHSQEFRCIDKINKRNSAASQGSSLSIDSGISMSQQNLDGKPKNSCFYFKNVPRNRRTIYAKASQKSASCHSLLHNVLKNNEAKKAMCSSDSTLLTSSNSHMTNHTLTSINPRTLSSSIDALNDLKRRSILSDTSLELYDGLPYVAEEGTSPDRFCFSDDSAYLSNSPTSCTFYSLSDEYSENTTTPVNSNQDNLSQKMKTPKKPAKTVDFTSASELQTEGGERNGKLSVRARPCTLELKMPCLPVTRQADVSSANSTGGNLPFDRCPEMSSAKTKSVNEELYVKISTVQSRKHNIKLDDLDDNEDESIYENIYENLPCFQEGNDNTAGTNKTKTESEKTEELYSKPMKMAFNNAGMHVNSSASKSELPRQLPKMTAQRQLPSLNAVVMESTMSSNPDCATSVFDNQFLNQPVHDEQYSPRQGSADTVSLSSLIIDSDLIIRRMKLDHDLLQENNTCQKPDVTVPPTLSSFHKNLTHKSDKSYCKNPTSTSPSCKSSNPMTDRESAHIFPPGLGSKHLGYLDDLSMKFGLSRDTLLLGNKHQLKSELVKMNGESKVGAIGGQLTDILQDCWNKSPSAKDIHSKLQNLLYQEA